MYLNTVATQVVRNITTDWIGLKLLPGVLVREEASLVPLEPQRKPPTGRHNQRITHRKRQGDRSTEKNGP